MRDHLVEMWRMWGTGEEMPKTWGEWETGETEMLKPTYDEIVAKVKELQIEGPVARAIAADLLDFLEPKPSAEFIASWTISSVLENNKFTPDTAAKAVVQALREAGKLVEE